jgi:adenylylsulfate kinase-like enzyme
MVVWLIGISGAGKTTLSLRAEQELAASGFSVKVLDGDAIREAYKVKLGFSRKDIEKK